MREQLQGRRSVAAAIAFVALNVACAHAQAPAAPTFDGKRALEHVRQLVAIGPRVAGTPGAQKARDYIKAQLSAIGLTAQEQPFRATTPVGPIDMVNLRVFLPG